LLAVLDVADLGRRRVGVHDIDPAGSMTTWAELELELPEPELVPEEAAPLEVRRSNYWSRALEPEEPLAALTVVAPAVTDWPSERLTSTTVPAIGEVRLASVRLLLA